MVVFHSYALIFSFPKVILLQMGFCINRLYIIFFLLRYSVEQDYIIFLFNFFKSIHVVEIKTHYL